MAISEVYDYFHTYNRSSFEVVACRGNEPAEADHRGPATSLPRLIYRVFPLPFRSAPPPV